MAVDTWFWADDPDRHKSFLHRRATMGDELLDLYLHLGRVIEALHSREFEWVAKQRDRVKSMQTFGRIMILHGDPQEGSRETYVSREQHAQDLGEMMALLLEADTECIQEWADRLEGIQRPEEKETTTPRLRIVRLRRPRKKSPSKAG